MARAFIAYRIWNSAKPFERWYVAQLQGEGGADYGYTTDSTNARQLSPKQVAAFRDYCADCGDTSVRFASVSR